jgi:hypothetical protein
LSYKTWKRKDQRKRSLERRLYWINIRKQEADKAFAEWKEKLPQLLVDLLNRR